MLFSWTTTACGNGDLPTDCQGAPSSTDLADLYTLTAETLSYDQGLVCGAQHRLWPGGPVAGGRSVECVVLVLGSNATGGSRTLPICNRLPELQEGFRSSMSQSQGTGRGMMWSRSPRHALLRQPQTSYCGHPAPRSVAGRPGWRSRDVAPTLNQEPSAGNAWMFQETAARFWGIHVEYFVPRDQYDAI